uniref:Methyltransferase FkbM domain-containing protein n=1 Tax=viral metagenome TaxID=1070528 RepID=A0A6C0ANX3_9ZZZZ
MEEYYAACKFIDENGQELNTFSRNVEEGSRYLAKKYISSNMRVLELGARYGTVSVYIDHILDNAAQQQVSVDPDSSIKNCLLTNRQNNNCTFNIFNGAISNKELYSCRNGCGWETKTYTEPQPKLTCEKINTMTLTDIETLYNIKFNCLLADCEGFLLQFIEENNTFFDNCSCIIYEEDCGKNHPINGEFIDYNIVEQFLSNKGFKLTETYVDFIGLSNKVWLK